MRRNFHQKLLTNHHFPPNPFKSVPIPIPLSHSPLPSQFHHHIQHSTTRTAPPTPQLANNNNNITYTPSTVQQSPQKAPPRPTAFPLHFHNSPLKSFIPFINEPQSTRHIPQSYYKQLYPFIPTTPQPFHISSPTLCPITPMSTTTTTTLLQHHLSRV